MAFGGWKMASLLTKSNSLCSGVRQEMRWAPWCVIVAEKPWQERVPGLLEQDIVGLTRTV